MNFPTYDCFLDKTVSFLRDETHDFLQTKDKSKKFIVASIATVLVWQVYLSSTFLISLIIQN